MNCPKCESPTKVINSRKKDGILMKINSTVARRRLCSSCGFRFSTKEVITNCSNKPVKALSMTKAVDGEWAVKVDENTPEWAKKMLINL
jgi:transcriptional regulator NrdR family protein